MASGEGGKCFAEALRKHPPQSRARRGVPRNLFLRVPGVEKGMGFIMI
jgi:hypothetical protein